MNQFNNDFHANISKEQKIKNELSMKKTHEPFHQHGTDGTLEQVDFKNHNKVYNWRDCQCKLKELLPINISEGVGSLIEDETGNDNFQMG
jgi:hypothetical protein